MKIALLTEGIFPYVIGGMQRHSTLMAKYLSRRGVEISLFHFIQTNHNTPISEIFTESELLNIELVELPYKRKSYFPGHYFSELWDYSRAVFQSMDQSKYDFIYVQGYAALYPLKKNLFNSPVGINFHGIEFYQAPASFRHRLSNIPLRYFANICFRASNVIFSLGGKLNELYQKNGFSAKVEEMPIGIAGDIIVSSINPTKQALNFLFVGRYEERKGIDQLNKALIELDKKALPFKMDFVGPIPESKLVKSPNVSYHGQVVDASMLESIYIKADFLVLPSSSEGMPTVILEAMARGCAIIATNVGAVANMVDETNGYLLEDNSPDTLIKFLSKAMDTNATTVDGMKKSSLKKVQSYTWEKVAERTEALIKKIIANG